MIDMLLLKFYDGDDAKEAGGRNGIPRLVVGREDDLSDYCGEFLEETQRISSEIPEAGIASQSYHTLRISSMINGLETYSVNLLLRKVTYSRFKGKNVGFWISSIFLTSFPLENELGEEKAWIPALGNSKENDLDAVHVGNLASYLDFRDKELRSLAKDSLDAKEEPASFPRALRVFRALTSAVSLMLLLSFFTFALGLESATFVTVFMSLPAAMVELVGGWRLLKSYRELDGDATLRSSASMRITPEQVVAHETDFTPDELSYMYTRYGGKELSKFKKELNNKRIVELTKRAKELLGKITKLESEGFYSEVVLSIDKAIRSLMIATLLSVGVETQGRQTTEWVPLLRRTIPSMKLEDIRSLSMLKDRINKGHDASKDETRIARQTVEPIIDETLDYLNHFLSGQCSCTHIPIPMRPPSEECADSPALARQSHMRSGNRKGIQDKAISKNPPIS